VKRADLNPALGYPGGPCHLEERVDKVVRNPRVKRDILDTIDWQGHLDKPQERIVYDRHVERDKRGRIILEPHVQHRMDLRGITAVEVKFAVKEFITSNHPLREMMERGEPVRFESKRMAPLVVVFVARGRDVVIITAFWKGIPDPPPPKGRCEVRAADKQIKVPYSFKKVNVEPAKKKRKKWPFQGFVDFQGLEIDVENKKGSFREGEDEDGTPWKVKMHHHYGEIRGTEGTDGDLLDAYIGPNADSPLVVVIHQQDPETKKYDEDKVMLGFDSVPEAIKAYKAQYDKPGFYQDHTVLNIGGFWRWCNEERNQGKKVKKAALAWKRYFMAAPQSVGINFQPPVSVANAAKRGLEYRQKQKGDKAGLTPSEAAKEGIGSGVQRAVNLKNRDTISPETIRQMNRFFSRHEKNKSVAPEHKAEPWKDKGYVAWLLWGGDPGKAWVEKVLGQMERADKSKTASAEVLAYRASYKRRRRERNPRVKRKRREYTRRSRTRRKTYMRGYRRKNRQSLRRRRRRTPLKITGGIQMPLVTRAPYDLDGFIVPAGTTGDVVGFDWHDHWAFVDFDHPQLGDGDTAAVPLDTLLFGSVMLSEDDEDYIEHNYIFVDRDNDGADERLVQSPDAADDFPTDYDPVDDDEDHPAYPGGFPDATTPYIKHAASRWKCDYCGSLNEDWALSCRNCGAPRTGAQLDDSFMRDPCYSTFLSTEGDQRQLDPDTGRRVPLREFGRGYHAVKYLEKEFDRWKRRNRDLVRQRCRTQRRPSRHTPPPPPPPAEELGPSLRSEEEENALLIKEDWRDLSDDEFEDRYDERKPPAHRLKDFIRRHASTGWLFDPMTLSVRMAQEDDREGGLFKQFLKELGDAQTTNPDTNRQVKLRSLNKTPAARKKQQEEFEKWRRSKSPESPVDRKPEKDQSDGEEPKDEKDEADDLSPEARSIDEEDLLLMREDWEKLDDEEFEERYGEPKPSKDKFDEFVKQKQEQFAQENERKKPKPPEEGQGGEAAEKGDEKKPKKSIEDRKREWAKNIKDPKERERIMKMDPKEFEAMVAAVSEDEEEGSDKKASWVFDPASLDVYSVR
jgi:hypothetical protein